MDSNRIIIREVGLRDGLQILPQVMPTENKLDWIRQAYEAGIREIEMGSFVPASRLPQLADTAELIKTAGALEGLTVSALVPNFRGAQDALQTEVDLILMPLSASHQHSLANLRKTPGQAVEEVVKACAHRDIIGSACLVEVGLSTAFGCTIQGRVRTAAVLDLVKASLDAGADLISLADTVGYADPRQVKDLIAATREVAGDRLSCAHFHNTRGLGMANVMAALESGITRFDACLGGLGGCPHAPGASGNVATEDLVYLMSSMGYSTGIDWSALMAVRASLARWLPGEPLFGSIAQAGLPKTMVPA
ncbi:MAG: hydroxymethylglutaryl-CoA lyase [Burkholderiaceae bacterium]